MRTRQHGLTHTGHQRDNNEDAYRIDPELGLFIICDGVGGNASGEIASQLAADLIREWVKERLPALAADSNSTDGHLGAMLATGIQHAAYMVFNAGLLDPDRKGMRTTASALLIFGGVAVLAHVGDARIYLARDGVISQLTDDHTVVADALRSGQLTPEHASRMRSNVITRSVGSRDHARPDIKTLILMSGDRLLLCTDGLYGYLTDPSDLPRLFSYEVERAAQRAIEHALDRGGKDNITAIFIECLGD